MNLFNPYQNQIYIELVNYINGCMSNNIDAYSKEDFLQKFLNEHLHMPDSLMETLVNSNLFFEADSDSYVPVLNWPDILPVRLSTPELSWLKYVLSDYKAELFLPDKLRYDLLEYLDTLDLPDLSKYIVDKRLHRKNPENPVRLFHDVLFPAVYTKRSIFLGKEEYLLFKIKYDPQSDLFQLLLYPIKTKENAPADILFVDVTNAFAPELGHPIKDGINYKSYEEYYQDALTCIKSHFVPEPVLLQINTTRVSSKNKTKKTMADDRCSYMFSSFDTRSYVSGEHLIMEIHYYDFQYTELIDHILSLGKYVKVLSPDSVISIIKEHFSSES